MTKETKDIFKLVGFVLAILFLIFLMGIGPVITIWSINTAFSLHIAYTFWTWLSMMWLQLVTFGGVIGQLSAIRSKL
jgi:hypothetical protein